MSENINSSGAEAGLRKSLPQLLMPWPFVLPRHQQLWFIDWTDPSPPRAWWRHQMEAFSELLAICAGIHRSPVNSPHKGQWRGALMFSLICAWINGWENNGEAGDLRRHRAHYDVTAMGRFKRPMSFWCLEIMENANIVFAFLINEFSMTKNNCNARQILTPLAEK